jgi:hypothetical protein
MKFSQFFHEATRVQPTAKTPDTPDKKAWRKPGDVGPVDRLTQLDKDQPGQRDYSRRGQYIQRVDKERDPVDKLLSTQGDEEPEMDPRYDPDSPQYVKRSRSGKEIQQGMAQGYKPGMDAVTSADRVMRDKTRDAESGGMREPMKVQGLQKAVPDNPYLRHGYQSSGVGIKAKLDQDDLDYLYAATQDDAPEAKEKKNTGLIDRRGVEDTKRRRPTARDVEALDPEAEKLAADKKAYLTPEVMAQQKQLRDALSKQDSKGVQKIAFKHKVTPQMLQGYIDMYGYNKQKNSNLLAQVQGMGLGEGRDKAAFGGNLGPEGKRYQNEDGTYDLTKMPAKLKKQALKNRAEAIVMTYLRQGGRDAYSPHEGIRSIADMDLEHIRSLKSSRDPGKDDPSNWVFAGGELNRLRGERDLTGEGSVIEKQAQGPRQLPDDAFEQMGKTWDEFTGGDSELATALQDTFGGDPTQKGVKAGIFAKGKYKNLPEAEREELRNLARDEGMPEPAVQKLFPTETPQADQNVMDSDFGTTGTPYVTDPERYDLDTTVDARDAVRKREVIQAISDKYGTISKRERDNTPEFKDFLKRTRDEKLPPPAFSDEGMD